MDVKLSFFDRLFDYYNNLSIARKLQFMGVSTVALVGFISLFFILIYQYNNEKTLLEKHVKTLTMVIADNMAPALLFDDTIQVKKILDSLRHKDEVRHAYALDENADLLNSYHKDRELSLEKGMLEDLNKYAHQQWRGLKLYTLVNVKADDQQVGSIVIVASIYAFIYQMLLEILILMLIVAASIAATYKYRALLRDSILKPIAELNSITSKIIKTKNLHNQIPVHSRDEIGELTKNFNSMLLDLDEMHTELNRQKDSLAHKAHHDTLTGLPNRALFNDRLDQAISKAKRHNEKIALFFIDLDHFKEINDTLGHEMGDEVLKFFAKRLKASVRTEDTIARLGGDEFMVIMENLQNSEAISVVANKIVSIVKEPIVFADQTLNLGTSIGISVYPQNGESSDQLIKNADSAMYKAKSEGRDNYQFYTPEMKAHAQKRLEDETDLRNAIEEDKLSLYFQPQFDVKSGRVSAYEVEVKWQHPQKGLTDFNAFKQLAVEMGAIIKIEQWLLKALINAAGQWQKKDVPSKRLIVNLSMKMVMDKAFLSDFSAMLSSNACSADMFVIALRESELLAHKESAPERLEELVNLGTGLVISEFGAAETSLHYLSHLPVKYLRVDSSLVLQTDTEDAVLKAVSALASSMGLVLTAKNIATVIQKEHLEENGCLLMQGELFGKAISALDMG